MFFSSTIKAYIVALRFFFSFYLYEEFDFKLFLERLKEDDLGFCLYSSSFSANLFSMALIRVFNSIKSFS